MQPLSFHYAIGQLHKKQVFDISNWNASKIHRLFVKGLNVSAIVKLAVYSAKVYISFNSIILYDFHWSTDFKQLWIIHIQNVYIALLSAMLAKKGALLHLMS